MLLLLLSSSSSSLLQPGEYYKARVEKHLWLLVYGYSKGLPTRPGLMLIIYYQRMPDCAVWLGVGWEAAETRAAVVPTDTVTSLGVAGLEYSK